MLKKPQFMRSFLPRPGTSLTGGKFHDAGKVTLPMGSAIHYIPNSLIETGISVACPLVRNWEKDIRVHHIVEGYGNTGSPRKKQFNQKTFQSAYFKRQKRFRRATNVIKNILVARDLFVFDYSPYGHMQTYQTSMWRNLNEWKNLFDGYITQLNTYSMMREHFVLIRMPAVLPSFEEFNKLTTEFTEQHAQIWRNPDLFWLREIWLAIKEGKGEDETVSKLRGIPVKENVFFAFNEGNNLSFLQLSDIFVRAAETDISKQFYNFIEKLIETRTVTETKVLENVPEAAEADEKNVPGTLVDKIADLGRVGKLTAAEQRRLVSLANRTGDIKNPTGEGTLKDLGKINPKDLAVPDKTNAKVNPLTIPSHAAKSTVSNFNSSYVEKVYAADMANMITSINKGGFIVTDYRIEDKVDALNHTQEYTLNVVPVNGSPSTIKFPLPVINPDGTFKAGGVAYTMDMQRVDLPIRKSGPSKVALTSYFGKLFIQRSEFSKFSYARWITKNISKIGFDPKDNRVVELRRAINKVPQIDLPRTYTSILPTITSFRSGDAVLYFNYNKREDFIGKELVAAAERKGMVACGVKGADILVMDMQNVIYRFDGTEYGYLGDLPTVVGGDWGAAPSDIAEVRLMGKKVPVAIILAYQLGLDKLLKRMKAKVRVIPTGTRPQVNDNEILITFKDEHFLIEKTSPEIDLIFSGFKAVEKIIKGFNATDFNKRGVYLPLFQSMRVSTFGMREILLMDDMFVDPITEEILTDMKEPTNMVDLYVRSAQLLATDNHPDETDPKFMRLRGTERITGLVYKSLVDAMRVQRAKPNPGMAKLSFPPKEPMQKLLSDTTVQLVSDANPIHNLKETEAVSLAGEGGRSARTLVKRSRVFHKNDLGVISESTPDSSKVGIRTFLTPNAKLTSVRGTMGEWSPEDGSTSLVSTTALVMPASHHDDGL